MEKAKFMAFIDEIGAAVGKPLTASQREIYAQHLAGYPEEEFAKAVYTIIETHRFRSFPLIREIRSVLDRIRFAALPPADEEGEYDRFPCGACNDTGWQIWDNTAYRPGESSSVASFCQCDKGRRMADGYEKYLEKQRLKRRLLHERRFEPEEDRRYDAD